MRKFASFMDLTNKGRTLDCTYHGTTSVHLEARIFAENGSDFEVGVSLWEMDIVSHSYDKQKNSLDIEYQYKPMMVKDEKGVEQEVFRNLSLQMERFVVPNTITAINVYDAKKP